MARIDFAAIRERFPIEAFFEQAMGQAPHAVTDGVRYAGCPNCGLSAKGSLRVSVFSSARGNTLWRCHSCSKGGDVIDAAAFLYRMSVEDAARQMLENSGIPETVKNWRMTGTKPVKARLKGDPAKVKEVISLLLRPNQPLDRAVHQYLLGRGIAEAAIQKARQQNLLLSLPSNPADAKQYLLKLVGRTLLEEAGMWRPESKAPGIAFRPLAFVTDGCQAAEFRLIRPVKSVDEARMISFGPMSPYVYRGSDTEHFVYVEGPTDLLSVLSFGSEKQVRGMPGCRRWEASWFDEVHGKDALLALDGDEPGLEATYEPGGILEVIQQRAATTAVLTFPEAFKAVTPPEDWDVNGLLRWKRSQMH